MKNVIGKIFNYLRKKNVSVDFIYNVHVLIIILEAMKKVRQ